jgi:hypothetical protein
MDHSLSLLAVNVNGLRDNKKRTDFLLRLLKGQWDIIVTVNFTPITRAG